MGATTGMTLEERAACIADVSLGSARGAERRRRIYERAITMLRESEFALSEALGALEPFAAISLARDELSDNVDCVDGPDLAITAKDVRRARAIIEKHKATSHDK
jgi:hypothetical protein